MKHVAFVCLVVASGCAHQLSRGADSGAPVSVKVETAVVRDRYQEKVGQETHRDKNGVAIGSSDITRTRLGKAYTKVVGWELRQGETAVDEADFFEFAGDQEAAATVVNRRKRGMLVNRVGLGILAAGIGGMGLAAIADGSLQKVGLTMFTFGAPIGGITAFMGKSKAERVHHFPLERAREAAEAAGRRARAKAGQ